MENVVNDSEMDSSDEEVIVELRKVPDTVHRDVQEDIASEVSDNEISSDEDVPNQEEVQEPDSDNEEGNVSVNEEEDHEVQPVIELGEPVEDVRLQEDSDDSDDLQTIQNLRRSKRRRNPTRVMTYDRPGKPHMARYSMFH